ncbi:MAG: SDR family oxidoreductase [Ignavibacteria bacterium]|jgi:UDP-glucose 4-epimerase|nr:SDR family oxidoreductase [Ignavibacteria bacterium]
MKFLVTGGAGFIGSNIVGELLKRNYEVKVLDNFSTGKRENLAEYGNNIELIEGDIRSYHIVKDAVAGVDVILHQAALPSVPRSINDPITSNEVNVTGTLNILEAARKNNVQKIVFASSSSVYGDNPKLPKDESMIPNPLSPYAVSKLSGEKYCSVFTRIYGLKTIALRYFNVFGPRQDPNSQYSAVIPKFIKAIMAGESPVIFGDGEQSRDFTFVRNVIEGNILAATTDCESGIAMNCACHGRITLNELVTNINEILGKDVKPVYKEPRAGDIKHSFADIDLAGKNLHYKPLVEFKEGLKITIESFK